MNEIFNKNETVADCNVCGANDYRLLFEEAYEDKAVFCVRRCNRCGLIATLPQPDSEFIEELYRDESYRNKSVSGTYCLDAEASSLDFSWALASLDAGPQSKRLLDIGCGAGHFVGFALSRDWDAYGAEPSSYAGAIAAEDYPGRIFNGYVKDSAFEPASFDVVTVWYVLEHVPDPAALIRTAKHYLKPGGRLLIAVPNAHYILFRRWLGKVLKRAPGSVHAHEHLYQFSPQTLKRLVSSIHFDRVRLAVASPYYVSRPILNFAKWISHKLVRLLFSLTGVHLGGLILIAHNREAPNQP